MTGILLIVSYSANILVAGVFGAIAWVSPRWASEVVFGHTWRSSPSFRVIGSFWLAIAILSIFGLFDPYRFSPLLFLQLIYQALWLLCTFFPLFLGGGNKREMPLIMTVLFVIWVAFLPFAIPWDYVLQAFQSDLDAMRTLNP
jgi:hypothetical protein